MYLVKHKQTDDLFIKENRIEHMYRNPLNFIRALCLTKLRMVLTLLTCVFAIWGLSGLIFKESIETAKANIEQTKPSKTSQPVSVRIQSSQSKFFRTEMNLQGRTAASRIVDIKTEVSGKIREIVAKEGEFVSVNTPILKIAVNDRAVRVDQAKASLKQRRLQVEAARKLAKQSFGTKVRLAEAEAQFSQAKADLVRFNIDLENTIITAPFDGIFNSKTKDLGAFLNAGDTIGVLVDLSPIKVVVQVSERDIGVLKTGILGSVILSDGSLHEGVVNYVASLSDNITRTFRVELIVPNNNTQIRAGLAAQVKLRAKEIKAHKVPQSSLTLSEKGKIGIKVVNKLQQIEFKPVDILNDGINGTWVSGLDDIVNIVVVGQDYVNTGQVVTTVDTSKRDLNEPRDTETVLISE